jgi:hypothetical protein
MRSERHKTWVIRGWRITVGASIVAFGISLVFHVWGDFGGHIIIGPFCLIVEGKNVPEIRYDNPDSK